METPGGRKTGLIIFVFLLTELSDFMIIRLKMLNHVFFLVKYIYVRIHKQNVKMESFCHNVGLRSLNIIWYNPK